MGSFYRPRGAIGSTGAGVVDIFKELRSPVDLSYKNRNDGGRIHLRKS